MAHHYERLRVTLDGTFTLGDMVSVSLECDVHTLTSVQVEAPTHDRHLHARRFWTHLVDSPGSTTTMSIIVCEPFGQYFLDTDRSFAARGNLILRPYPIEPLLHVNSNHYLELSTHVKMDISETNNISVTALGRVLSCDLSDDESHWNLVMAHRDYEPNDRFHYHFTIRYLVTAWMMTSCPPGTFAEGGLLRVLGFIVSHGPDPATWLIRALHVRLVDHHNDEV
ncbi:uncharacterized protein MELLADRAFT_105674 [Melampsora larici-populina 98AG31]|uniref:Uncharacterized protein n=1 Tax=Melampsora larici-populina (strain 98AG31 / pathotype 3-4-7) TaxID=747676 RepID=F4RJ02_MELLP|nr:uncharacterized protein MELLADRAFT_105674 [Melampsora larici-populina 98AG31]EGG07650.1 hypothetical protein MELLADRAFT_105674 [Melampsora larici-populina 98AG31]